jgi:hypothetical protein
MSLDAPYALSSFISQGLRGDTIRVTGHADSKRTYINAQEMLWVYIMSLGQIDVQVLDSGGFTINMLELANLVSTLMGNKKVLSIPDTSSVLTIYSPDVSAFNALASELSLELSNVSKQVALVTKFHTNFLNFGSTS